MAPPDEAEETSSKGAVAGSRRDKQIERQQAAAVIQAKRKARNEKERKAKEAKEAAHKEKEKETARTRKSPTTLASLSGRDSPLETQASPSRSHNRSGQASPTPGGQTSPIPVLEEEEAPSAAEGLSGKTFAAASRQAPKSAGREPTVAEAQQKRIRMEAKKRLGKQAKLRYNASKPPEVRAAEMLQAAFRRRQARKLAKVRRKKLDSAGPQSEYTAAQMKREQQEAAKEALKKREADRATAMTTATMRKQAAKEAVAGQSMLTAIYSDTLMSEQQKVDEQQKLYEKAARSASPIPQTNAPLPFATACDGGMVLCGMVRRDGAVRDSAAGWLGGMVRRDGAAGWPS